LRRSPIGTKNKFRILNRALPNAIGKTQSREERNHAARSASQSATRHDEGDALIQRAFSRRRAQAVQRDGALRSSQPPDVAHVEDRKIPGPAGSIPVRVYTPAGNGPFPVLVYITAADL